MKYINIKTISIFNFFLLPTLLIFFNTILFNTLFIIYMIISILLLLYIIFEKSIILKIDKYKKWYKEEDRKAKIMRKEYDIFIKHYRDINNYEL